MVEGRELSSCFLMWYLENYYRLDADETVDLVCDKPGDKGVDGIFVNESENSITIFQAKLVQADNKKIGDNQLKAFSGTLQQFKDKQAIENLLISSGRGEVAQLVKRLELVEKIDRYTVRGEFISNVDADANGLAFLKSAPQISFIGKSNLATSYISDQRKIPKRSGITFDISKFKHTEYKMPPSTRVVITPIKAEELIDMPGIPDQSVYAYNVRGPLSNSQVNKDIAESVRDKARHNLFPLFHNGITIIAKSITVDEY